MNESTPLTVTRNELLVDGSDAEFRKLVHNLFAFFARHQAVRDGHGSFINLAGVEYTVLISIYHLSKYNLVYVSTVADHLHVSGTFITRVVKNLEKSGLIKKIPNEIDRRKIQVHLTDEAKSRLRDLSVVQSKVNDVQFGNISKEEFVQLNNIVEKLIISSDKAIALQKFFQREIGGETDEVA